MKGHNKPRFPGDSCHRSSHGDVVEKKGALQVDRQKRRTSLSSFGSVPIDSSIHICRQQFITFESQQPCLLPDTKDKLNCLVSNDHKLPGTHCDIIATPRETLRDYYIEREKRHFPDLSNHAGKQMYYPRGRRYIPHGAGNEPEFTPHGTFIEPEYTDCGPDWKSRLRWLPPPNNPNYIAEIWPDHWKGMRTFPWMARCSKQEWGMYPEGPKGYDATLRCTFDGKHKATNQSQEEITHAMLLGKSRLVYHKRNGISLAAPGDKNYQAVEYSPKFHNGGTTLPLVNFGGSSKKKHDTFIPLEQVPNIPRESFSKKERTRRLRDDVDQVKKLETWRPATPLVAPPHVIMGGAIPEQETTSTSS